MLNYAERRKLNFQGNYKGELLNEPSQTNFKCIRASNVNDQSELLCVLSGEVIILNLFAQCIY